MTETERTKLAAKICQLMDDADVYVADTDDFLEVVADMYKYDEWE